MQKYPLAMRWLHWIVALCVIGMLAVGLYMTGLPREDALRTPLYLLHKSFGVTLFALVMLRIMVRWRSQVPPLPERFSRWEKVAANLGHKWLYALLLLMPLTGYAMSDSVGFGVQWFGVPLPHLFPVSRANAEFFEELHEVLAYLLMATIAGHVAAVVKHWWVDKENLLKRML